MPRSAPAPAWRCSPGSPPRLPCGPCRTSRVTVMEGVPSMYAAMLHDPQRSDHDLSRLRVGSRAAPRCRSRCCSGSRRRSAACARGLRALGVLAGGDLQPAGPSAGRLDRAAGQGRRAPGVDDAGADVDDGEPGESRARAQRDEGYWGRPATRGRPSSTAGCAPATWAQRRRRLLLPRRPHAGADQPRRHLVFPREVEEVLHDHPDVLEAAVIGRAARRPSARRCAPW